MSTFWLSHHRDDALHRCVRVRGVHVCARCLGTYPTLAVALTLLVASCAPLVAPYDWLSIALIVPALIDWTKGQLDPLQGSNPRRIATGVLLGLGLSWPLAEHLRRPWPWPLIAQLSLAGAVALLTFLLAARRPRSKT